MAAATGGSITFDLRGLGVQDAILGLTPTDPQTCGTNEPAGASEQCAIDYLVSNEFNAVRLPLNARVITWAMRKEAGNGYPYVVGERCGQYNGWESMKILDLSLIHI